MSSPSPLYVELVAARAAEPARSWFLERIEKAIYRDPF